MFPLIHIVGSHERGDIGAVIYDLHTLVDMSQQQDYGLYAIMLGHDVDKVLVTLQVQVSAAIEWKKRYPNGVKGYFPDWEIYANSIAQNLLQVQES